MVTDAMVWVGMVIRRGMEIMKMAGCKRTYIMFQSDLMEAVYEMLPEINKTEDPRT